MTDHEMMEQFQAIIQGMEQMENRLRQEIKVSETRLEQKIRESETRTRVFVENEVSKKIETLFDGYKLTHEKQWELERRTDRLQEQVESLAARIEALENKPA